MNHSAGRVGEIGEIHRLNCSRPADFSAEYSGDMSEFAYRRIDTHSTSELTVIEAKTIAEAMDWARSHEEFFPDGDVQIFQRIEPESMWTLVPRNPS